MFAEDLNFSSDSNASRINKPNRNFTGKTNTETPKRVKTSITLKAVKRKQLGTLKLIFENQSNKMSL